MIEHASTFNRVLKEFLERVSHERADAVGSPVALVG
jgi:hypothetical protein